MQRTAQMHSWMLRSASRWLYNGAAQQQCGLTLWAGPRLPAPVLPLGPWWLLPHGTTLLATTGSGDTAGCSDFEAPSWRTAATATGTSAGGATGLATGA